tara:strand:+ start:168 stop:377 length:210 start_codon:yes stop_codon:yes gene_type:complete
VTGINHDKSKKINPSLIYKEIPVTAYNERIKQEMNRRLRSLLSRQEQLERELQEVKITKSELIKKIQKK